LEEGKGMHVIIPLFLHFGHYKAVIDKDKLSKMHSVIADIAVNLGYSPKRWQKGLAVMLEKKRGVILISKLCAILLMEADFNFCQQNHFRPAYDAFCRG
jgi:hypothetical protein